LCESEKECERGRKKCKKKSKKEEDMRVTQKKESVRDKRDGDLRHD
jgi:hypothetical protein